MNVPYRYILVQPNFIPDLLRDWGYYNYSVAYIRDNLAAAIATHKANYKTKTYPKQGIKIPYAIAQYCLTAQSKSEIAILLWIAQRYMKQRYARFKLTELADYIGISRISLSGGLTSLRRKRIVGKHQIHPDLVKVYGLKLSFYLEFLSKKDITQKTPKSLHRPG